MPSHVCFSATNSAAVSAMWSGDSSVESSFTTVRSLSLTPATFSANSGS
ncbi:hypothetical protein [Streptomyces sp. H34-S4]|nr:hypothetical protein [Streptomyces sp. H34-S4]MCY0938025.1 hypothetical protein [Streptomyces sp. H34-S4]